MRKIAFIFCLALLIAFAASTIQPVTDNKSDYIRIRIIANSDSPFDQNLKLALRNKVTDYLEALLSHASSKEQAYDALQSQKQELEAFCNRLLENHAPYGCTVALRKELFPLRTYDGEVYPQGEYDALVITLGEGEGENWWCVAYPPLCFINGTPNPDAPNKVTYRSVFIEWLAELLGLD